MSEFEDGVKFWMVNKSLRYAPESDRETCGDRKTIRIKTRRQVILVRRNDAKRVTRRTHNQPVLRAENYGQRSGYGAFATAVNA